MIVYVKLYGDGQSWWYPLDTDDLPEWARNYTKINDNIMTEKENDNDT